MVDFSKAAFLPLSLGRVLTTPAAARALAEAGVNAMESLVRHAAGDWGEVDADDSAANDDALRTGGRIHSVYTIPAARRPAVVIWIVTEADRSATTILLPSDA